jgi:hypothetical protein
MTSSSSSAVTLANPNIAYLGPVLLPGQKPLNNRVRSSIGSSNPEFNAK